MTRTLLLIPLASMFAWGSIEAAEKVCAPNPMVKIVTRLDVPRIPADHFARVPKTLYWSGTQYGRVEEAYNPATGLQLLVVIDEPHLWMANLASRTGKYSRDAGPSYVFRAPILGEELVRSPVLRGLEMGCDIPWLREAGAKEGSGTPTFAMDYLEYAVGQAFDRRLFEKPVGIQFTEEKWRVHACPSRGSDPVPGRCALSLAREGGRVFGVAAPWRRPKRFHARWSTTHGRAVDDGDALMVNSPRGGSDTTAPRPFGHLPAGG